MVGPSPRAVGLPRVPGYGLPCKVCLTPHIRLFSGGRGIRGKGLLVSVPLIHRQSLSRASSQAKALASGGRWDRMILSSATHELLLKQPLCKRNAR